MTEDHSQDDGSGTRYIDDDFPCHFTVADIAAIVETHRSSTYETGCDVCGTQTHCVMARMAHDWLTLHEIVFFFGFLSPGSPYAVKENSTGETHLTIQYDMTAHDLEGACVCGPADISPKPEHVVMLHHSLDGRDALVADLAG